MVAPALFDPGIAVAEMDPRTAVWGLYPEEKVFVAGAVRSRRREFTAGRRCARTAIAALGSPVGPILQQKDRSPAWPEGVVGSISHTDRLCVAAVARRRDGYRAIGVDVEPAEPLPEGLTEIICDRSEIDWLESLPSAERGLWARVLFSAKEAVFKLQFSLSGRMLEFDALSVRINRAAGAFVATFHTDAAPFEIDDELTGRVSIREGHIGCGVVLADDAATRLMFHLAADAVRRPEGSLERRSIRQ